MQVEAVVLRVMVLVLVKTLLFMLLEHSLEKEEVRDRTSSVEMSLVEANNTVP